MSENGLKNLMEAIRLGELECVRESVVAGADINGWYFDWSAERDDHCYTPLSYAVRHERLDIVKFLLEAGANINEGAEEGDTALVMSCCNDNAVIVKLLIESGADPSKEPSALWYAAKNEHYETIGILLQGGAKATGWVHEFILNSGREDLIKLIK
jgi:hypothetical protein